MDDAEYLDSTTLMELDALPESLVVIGAGSVGLELAQAMSRLGVEVTVLARSTLLSNQDADLGAELAIHLRSEGLRVELGARPVRVESGPLGRTVSFVRDGNEQSVTAEAILLAAGRNPNTSGISLEEAGVELVAGGEILVDEFLQTSNPNIYAAGDVTGGPMHVYVAAQVLLSQLRTRYRGTASRSAVRWCPR